MCQANESSRLIFTKRVNTRCLSLRAWQSSFPCGLLPGFQWLELEPKVTKDTTNSLKYKPAQRTRSPPLASPAPRELAGLYRVSKKKPLTFSFPSSPKLRSAVGCLKERAQNVHFSTRNKEILSCRVASGQPSSFCVWCMSWSSRTMRLVSGRSATQKRGFCLTSVLNFNKDQK